MKQLFSQAQFVNFNWRIQFLFNWNNLGNAAPKQPGRPEISKWRMPSEQHYLRVFSSHCFNGPTREKWFADSSETESLLDNLHLCFIKICQSPAVQTAEHHLWAGDGDRLQKSAEEATTVANIKTNRTEAKMSTTLGERSKIWAKGSRRVAKN